MWLSKLWWVVQHMVLLAMCAVWWRVHVSGVWGRLDLSQLYKRLWYYILNSISWLSSQCAHGKLSIARKRVDHPKILRWQKTFKKCNPPDFNFSSFFLNFIPVSQLMKIFPIWCDVNFFFFFVLFNALKTDTKLTLHHMGKILLFNLST